MNATTPIYEAKHFGERTKVYTTTDARMVLVVRWRKGVRTAVNEPAANWAKQLAK